MRILTIETEPETGIQERLDKEGHDVHVLIREKSKEPTFKDKHSILHFYTSSKQCREIIKKLNPDVLFKIGLMEPTVNIPKKTIGPSRKTRKMEMNRQYSIEIASSLGMLVPKTTEDFKEAKKFKGDKIILKSNDSEVIQSLGEKTYVIYKRDLDKYEEIMDKEKKKVILQEFIEGSEIAFGGYYSYDHFIRPYTFIQEYKYYFPAAMGNLQLCGEHGSCGEFRQELEEPFMSIINRHEKIIKGHYGFFDLNTIFTKKGDIYFLEYTTRRPFPTEHEVITMLDMEYGNFLNCIINGNDYKVKGQYFASLRILDMLGTKFSAYLPPTNGNISFTKINVEEENGYYYNMPISIEMLLITGHAGSVEESCKYLYEYMEGVNGQGIYYLENDIGKNWVW